MEKLRYMMRSTYQAHLIPLSSSLVEPGRLLETYWGAGWPWNSNPRFRRVEGTAFDVLQGIGPDASGYTIIDSESSMIEGTFQDTFTFGVDFPLAQLGLSIGGEVKNDRKVTVEIGSITAKSFENGFAGHRLRRDLRALRRTDREAFNWVDDDFLVTMTYHVSDLRFKFKETGGLSAKVELEQAGLEVGGNANWSSDHDLKLDGHVSVPFSVQGLRV